MRLDSEIGHIVITHPNGIESHILLPIAPSDFDFNELVFNPILSIVTDSLGAYQSVIDDGVEEKRSAGVYTLDKKTFRSNNYELNFIQEEFYFGASGGTEQIILAIFAGGAGGISTAITTQIFNAIAQHFSNKNNNKNETEADDSTLFPIIEKILAHRFKAEPPFNFSNAKYINQKITFEITDSINKKYFAKIQNSNGSFLLDVGSAS